MRSSLVGVFLASIFQASPAAAVIPLEWDAPEGCPTTVVVLDELRQALGHDPVDLGRVSRVRGVVVADTAASPRHFRLTLEVAYAEQRSVRTFEAGRCEDLGRAAALAIAIAVHSERDGGGPPVGVTEVDVPPSASASAPSDAGEAAHSESEAPRSPSWSGAAHAVLDAGALFEPAIGVGVGARAALAPFELSLMGVFLPNQRQAVGLADSVQLGLVAAGLRACVRVLDAALVVGGCIAGEAGRFTARGVGLTPGREVHDLWLAVGPSALARTAFAGPLQLELLVEPLLPLARKQYAVNGTDVIHSPSAVDLRVQVGLSIGAGGNAP